MTLDTYGRGVPAANREADSRMVSQLMTPSPIVVNSPQLTAKSCFMGIFGAEGGI
jgi:hypothetical protein